MTGRDPGADLRGRYDGPDTARRLLRGLGGSLARAVARRGFVEVAPSLAGRGDLVMGRGPRGALDGLGVCVGRYALFATPKGLRAVPLRHWQKAWRI